MNGVLRVKQDSKIQVQYCTDKGRLRPNNEDFCSYYIPDDRQMRETFGCMFAVADGVGGSRAGEVASSEAVNVLLQEYYFGDYSRNCHERFRQAYDYTALHIYDLAQMDGSCNKMMCTLTALLIKDGKFSIMHVGDSKIFLLRKNELIQLTKDHSIVGKMVRMGLITKEQARVHPSRHVLLRSLGERPILPADFYSGFVQKEDLFFLSTDGIFEHLTEEEIRNFLLNKRGLEVEQLIETANQRGGEDNMTVMCVENII